MAKQHLQLQKAHAALDFLVSGDLILVEKLTCRIPIIYTEHAEWIYGKRIQGKLRCMVEINAVITIEDGIYNSWNINSAVVTAYILIRYSQRLKINICSYL